MFLALHHSPRRERAAASAFTQGLAAVAGVVLSWPGRVLRHRRLMTDMSRMSDYELRDIGLSRQDVMDAGAVPLGEDPSRLFAARATERRGAKLHRRR